jgi:hypothetical protein
VKSVGSGIGVQRKGGGYEYAFHSSRNSIIAPSPSE